MLDGDFARLSVSNDHIRAGQRVNVGESLRLPDLNDFDLELDLVAENVTWFELAGATPLKLSFRHRQFVPRL